MNRNRNLKTLWLIPLVALLVLAALPAQSAQAQLIGGDQQVATMAIHGGSISFAPKISFEEMTLTVAGRGHVSKQSFRSGETASFAPVDQEGFQLPDGTYKWELVVSPRPQDLNPAAFRSGKVSADGRMMEMAAAPKGQRQFGVFTIKGGVMVDPNLVEAESPRTLGASSIAAPPSAAARAAEHNDRDGN
ncbi:MAG: hypothetical protein GY769_09910 [bacterium]|nr:hypothetical protein [bacterium]